VEDSLLARRLLSYGDILFYHIYLWTFFIVHNSRKILKLVFLEIFHFILPKFKRVFILSRQRIIKSSVFL
jgi:hypothetical protein